MDGDSSNNTDLESQRWINKVHPGNRVRVYIDSLNVWSFGIVR